MTWHFRGLLRLTIPCKSCGVLAPAGPRCVARGEVLLGTPKAGQGGRNPWSAVRPDSSTLFSPRPATPDAGRTGWERRDLWRLRHPGALSFSPRRMAPLATYLSPFGVANHVLPAVPLELLGNALAFIAARAGCCSVGREPRVFRRAASGPRRIGGRPVRCRHTT